MTEQFHKPTKFPNQVFSAFHGGYDPAEQSRVAHETAQALLARVRNDPDPAVIERLVNYTDTHGIDAIAELWAASLPRSLPGALWRIYLVRLLIRNNPTESSYLFQRGLEVTTTIDPVVAGAEEPTGPTEITALADRILRGAFEGDFADALDRAAAFCRIESTGCTSLADDLEAHEPERATELTTRALRLHTIATEMSSCAKAWRAGALD